MSKITLVGFFIIIVANAAWAVETPPDDTKPPDPVPFELAPDHNPNVASIVDAKRTGEHPERLSPLLKAKPFDAARFKQNPQAYLDEIEPGRIWQSAAPGKEIPVLRISGLATIGLPRLGVWPLKVVAPAGAPVNFLATDLGTFDNDLPSVTVIADEKGIATANFHASPGVIGPARVMAASPMASGQVKFHLHVYGDLLPPDVPKPVEGNR